MHRTPLLLIAAIAVALIASTTATATDATLRTTVNAWSKKIGADAHLIALAAQQRHPRRMTSDAGRFHTDAFHARAAIATQKPSTAKGQRARRLALTAFSDYALAGTKWAASGLARLAHHRSASIAYANAGAAYAHTADKLLLTAGKLLG